MRNAHIVKASVSPLSLKREFFIYFWKMENHLSASCLDSLPSTQVCSTECSSIDFGFHVSDDKDVLGELKIELIDFSNW